MTSPSVSAEQLRRAVFAARATGQPVSSQGDGLQVALDEAYQVQASLVGDQPLIAYKLGLASPAKQQQMDIAAPIYGRITMQIVFLGSPVAAVPATPGRIEVRGPTALSLSVELLRSAQG